MPDQPLALTLALIARAHPTPVADDATALALRSDAELAPGLAAALAADRLGETRAQQTGLGGLAVEVAWQLAEALPLVDVGQDLALGEGASGRPQLTDHIHRRSQSRLAVIHHTHDTPVRAGSQCANRRPIR